MKMPSNNNKTILPEFLRLRSWEECVYNPVTHQHGVCVGTIQSCVLKMNTGQSERLLFSLRSALLAGYRNTNGTFNNRGNNGNWWSSSATGSTTAINRNLNTGNRGVNRNSNNKANGFSVRCLKDYTWNGFILFIGK